MSTITSRAPFAITLDDIAFVEFDEEYQAEDYYDAIVRLFESDTAGPLDPTQDHVVEMLERVSAEEFLIRTFYTCPPFPIH